MPSAGGRRDHPKRSRVGKPGYLQAGPVASLISIIRAPAVSVGGCRACFRRNTVLVSAQTAAQAGTAYPADIAVSSGMWTEIGRLLDLRSRVQTDPGTYRRNP